MTSISCRNAVVPWLALLLPLISPAMAAATGPIAPHRENPRYFLFRERPVFLFTSGEHYGAVLNRDFDQVRYLDELRSCRFNLTRLFAGTYREVPGSFQIQANTLAPAPGRYAAPWARSNQPGAVDGGNKFDLAAWDPVYFERLRNFVVAAAERGIVVEVVLFCPFYEENLWLVNPMNARNNVAGLGTMPRTEVFTLKHPSMISLHEAFVRKVVSELHPFDNVYFEICNEPYFGGVTLDWQARIAQVVVETEARLGGARHMIAQNIANGRAKIDHPDPAVGLFNFHYATPPDVVALNAGLNRAIGDDETGFKGNDDRTYRTEAWEFLLAGGSTFSNLDYSFTVDHPDGTAPVKPPTPGGGGRALRKRLTILRDFLSALDFVGMSPDRSWISGGVPEKVTAQALARQGRQYAVYLSAGGRVDLELNLPPGSYRAEWVNPRTGAVDISQDIVHQGGQTTLSSPPYDEDIALRLLGRSSLGPGAESSVRAADRPDVIVADFEGDTYGGWIAEGESFGAGPARGTLPGQMAVSGFLGHGLVNSFVKGDASTGTLTSPPFRIERFYLNFLIGGGRHPGSTCVDLLLDGQVVRTATGPNDKPGGTEQLDWAAWDVREFQGKTAVLRIVDHESGGWGHINVDQIVQSDRRRGVEPVRRELIAGDRYLHLPVRQDAPMRRLRVLAGGRIVREFDIKLAEERHDFRVFLDLQPFDGQTLTLETELPAGSKALEQIHLAAEVPDVHRLYHEPHRPQFHFTSRRGWLNDPNGLLWFDGEYHLYYQHNPYGWDWGNMHWGHAVSRDLVHWTEQPTALYPREYGDWCFSGSGLVDRRNVSGFGTPGSTPLVVAFTSTGRGECIAYSNDRGRTWTEYDKNPVVRHEGRDPRLLWHEPTKRWVMAVYDETKGGRSIAFHSSPDLKTWRFESRIDGFFECPELFELPVEGDGGRRLWVVHAADGQYRLGQFDGRRFEPETGKIRLWHGNFYASQTFSDTPDGRRIQIGWANGITFPGEPFNQQMTVPCELTLRPTTDGVRLFARPVAELATLRRKEYIFDALDVHEGVNVLAGPAGDLLEINADAEVGDKGVFTLNVRGTPVVYDASKSVLSCGDLSASLAPEGSVVKLRILLDRGSIEVFGNDGRVAISRGLGPGGAKVGLSLTANPPVKFRSIRIHELGSAWK